MTNTFESRSVVVDGITYRVSISNGKPISITAMVQRANRKEPGLTTLVQRHLWNDDSPNPMSARAKLVLAAI